MEPVTDTEMIQCLTKLVRSGCMINKEIGCMRCPSQREFMGCILRMYRHKLIDAQKEILRLKLIEAEKCIDVAQENYEKVKAELAALENL